LPLCFDFLPDGRLLLVSNQRRALLTLEGDSSLADYADLAPLSPFGCNDIVVDGRGNAYVSDAGCGPTWARTPRTASASTRRARRGTPTFRTGTVCGSARAARASARSNSIAARSPAVGGAGWFAR
jgi:hypothetical protein